ncbi:M48 family metallopeptidase [Sphingomonas sp. BK345]|uniref:tetratricopeptide repeat protein n=1 Tax=Sphingomonas sp. BK345 TaxID=2586980 RepID=UPI00161EDA83|nr:tetratricopeptide repeat protein [Sphingomonas sp. BK345]MBB3474535.1 Flp pilus assembly protein TadD [Sphingomonas sp. BK345]
MRTSGWVAVATLVALVAGPAAAKDRVGYQAISAGSLAQAEQTIDAERAIFPTRPELMLNLAAVYARTGRVTQARSLYGQVLDQEPVAMDLADGSVQSSHALAQRGLSRLGSTIASR